MYDIFLLELDLIDNNNSTCLAEVWGGTLELLWLNAHYERFGFSKLSVLLQLSPLQVQVSPGPLHIAPGERELREPAQVQIVWLLLFIVSDKVLFL